MIGEHQDDDRVPTAEELREQFHQYYRERGMGHLLEPYKSPFAKWMGRAVVAAMLLMMLTWVVAVLAGMVGLIRWGFGF